MCDVDILEKEETTKWRIQRICVALVTKRWSHVMLHEDCDG